MLCGFDWACRGKARQQYFVVLIFPRDAERCECERREHLLCERRHTPQASASVGCEKFVQQNIVACVAHISTRQRAVIDVDNAVMIGHAQSYKSVITLA